MKEILINRVIISQEAKFDYSDLVKGGSITSRAFCNEFDDYLDKLTSIGKIVNKNYLRMKYYDEGAGKYLLFFLKRRNRFRCLQVWEVVGICDDRDWSLELENNGSINRWLCSKVYDLPKENDWVADMIERKREWKTLMEEMYGIQL